MKKSKISLRRLLSLTLALCSVLCVLPTAYGFWGKKIASAAISTFSKQGAEKGAIVFSAEDFTSRLSKNAKLSGIVINELPAETAGTLSLDGRALMAGEGISLDKINTLKFTPATDEALTTFSFIPVFENDSTNQAPVDITISVGKEANSAPVAKNVNGETYVNVYVEVPLSAFDADGDKVAYKLLDQPKLGTAVIDVDKIKYTPGEKTGTDKFTYVAIDSMGNSSDAANVSISVKKNAAKMTYSDMSTSAAHYSALRLSQMGVITGQKIGSSYFFNPSAAVSRNEFIAMTVAAAKLKVEPSFRTTFADDEKIPVWAKAYITTAAQADIVNGYPAKDGTAVLNGSKPITMAEAAVILNNATKLANENRTAFFSDASAIPTWAAQAAINLDSVNAIKPDKDGKLNPTKPITRATACQMLYTAVCHMQEKK